MTRFIKVGGLIVIVAVLGIFVFILMQILPLFRGARIRDAGTVQLPTQDGIAVGIDEWGELPFILAKDGSLTFFETNGHSQKVLPPFVEPKEISAFHYDPQHQQIIYGTSDGYFSIADINYDSTFENGHRRITQNLKASPWYQIGNEGFSIVEIRYADSGDQKVAAAIENAGDHLEVHAATLTQTQSLLGSGEIVVGQNVNVTQKIQGRPVRLAVSGTGTDFVVGTDRGDVYYFFFSDDQVSLRQTFSPFADQKDKTISCMEYLFGGVSLVLVNGTGNNRVFSLYEKPGSDYRSFGQTKQFDSLPGPANFYATSVRNKAFLTGSGSFASLRYSTTESVRWESKLPFTVAQAVIGGKYNRIVFLDSKGALHFYSLDDPHPESGFKALFGKIWYEGANGPAYTWQSTGGTDDFEPKLSLIPLVIGTLKGTLYAMIFSVPIALLAAIYTSQFLHPRFRALVKPSMEIMASLPSVVLGFLAALWMAPILETRVPSILIALILIPAISFLFGWIWARLPINIRVRVREGYEWLLILPVLLGIAYFSWHLGPWLEKMIFLVKDPQTGRSVADFRLWWPQTTGLPFEQRNSLVVGFMMGFAVIPIVFTIAEDALSNVPAALRSGSLALGASRWQTSLQIVLPTASAGIFSAFMIGLGRAVGETMIVVMATGNTPILGFNIFSGMRTLSANIAVELPEAPVHSTLYRSLFLGAMALFLMTFVVNTVAEIMRQHLREKYKTV